MDERPKIVVIAGMTATGKSDLAVAIARKFNGEIVSADSRQVYRGLDLGTGKIRKREMRGVPHHLLDIADPRRAYSVSRFQNAGRKAVADILRRGKLPVIVGGTGFYIDSLVYDIRFPAVKPDYTLRKKLDRQTTGQLVLELKNIDPKRVESIDTKNRVRLIRAIEIATLYGPVEPLTTSTPYDPLWVGLTCNRDILQERVSARLKKRIRAGMLKEFENLHKNGLSYARMEALGLEYRFGSRLLRKLVTRREFEEQLTNEIMRYAKRQMTWFKRKSAIHWITLDKTNEAIDLVAEFLQNNTIHSTP
jgi:tRNA dimethylallyltransferase